MVVEVYLQKDQNRQDALDESLPDNLLELEMMKGELSHSLEKLKESTDLLTEEFRKSEDSDAREFYEYIQDNLDIMRRKTERMDEITARINQKKGLFKSSRADGDASTSAGGLVDSQEDGHLV